MKLNKFTLIITIVVVSNIVVDLIAKLSKSSLFGSSFSSLGFVAWLG